jgi:hypothetical protein
MLMNLVPVTDTASANETIPSEGSVAKTSVNSTAVSVPPSCDEPAQTVNSDESRRGSKRNKKDRQKTNTDQSKLNADRSATLPPPAAVPVSSSGSSVVEICQINDADSSKNTDPTSLLLASSSAAVVRNSAPKDLPVATAKPVVQAKAIVPSSATGT